jgi:hypothetical protein
LFGNESQYLFRMPFQRRNASTARFRRATPGLVPALQPSHRRTRAKLSAAMHCFYGFDHAPPQFSRIRHRHRSRPGPSGRQSQIPLSKAFGSSAAVWLKMQMDYDLAQIAKNASKIKVRRVLQPA